MNLIKKEWTQKDYLEYLEYLKSLKEDIYRDFHKKLTTTKYEILGLRVPIQRKIAKEIKKGNYKSFLKLCQTTFYEEVNIEGFIIASLKEEERNEYFDSFITKIDNWAICDGFCNSIKLKEEEKDAYFKKIKNLLKEKEEFKVRVGLVLLLTHFVEEKYIEEIFVLVDKIKREEYYINMAIAWLVAECFIKEPDKTIKYLKENNLNKFTQNKTISKIRDSYRVTKKMKDELLKYRK